MKKINIYSKDFDITIEVHESRANEAVQLIENYAKNGEVEDNYIDDIYNLLDEAGIDVFEDDDVISINFDLLRY